MDQKRYEIGLAKRKQVLGDAYVDKALANVDDFNRDFQRLLTEYCWGETWGDDTLKPRERSILNLGMIVAPCSIRTMSEIASGVTASLLSRAADVVLKEKRRLVLAIRETPLHVGHLRSMTVLAEIGAVIAPIVPAFYNRPRTVDDIVNHTCGRLLDLFGIDIGTVKRWKGGSDEK